MKKFEFVSPASSWSCPPKSPTDDNKAANKIFINKKLSGFSENIQSLLLVIWKITPARAEPWKPGGPRGDHRGERHRRFYFLAALAMSSCLSGLFIHVTVHLGSFLLKKVKKKKMNTPTQSKTCLSDSVVLPHLLLVLPGHRGGGGQLWGGHRNLFKSLTSTCRAPPSTSRTPTLSCLGSPLTPSSPSWASCSSSPSSTSSSSSSTSSAAPWSRSGWKKSPNQTLRKSNLCRWWGRAIWSTEKVERRARGWRCWRRGRACWTCKLNTEQGLMSEPWQFLLL